MPFCTMLLPPSGPHVAARAAVQPAAVNPDQDGIGLACFLDGRPNIERQAVLALRRLHPIGGLAADRSEFRRLACALPGFHRLWCPPPQVACGRGSIGNPQERHHAVLFISRELSAVDRDGGCGGLSSGSNTEDSNQSGHSNGFMRHGDVSPRLCCRPPCFSIRGVDCD